LEAEQGVLSNERLMMRSNSIEQQKLGLRLTSMQREILVGILLGDAHLETQNDGQTYRLKIEQSEHHRTYVEHLYRVFEDWVLTPPQARQKRSAGSESINWWFQSVSHPAFRFYAQQFYRQGKKCVPKLIHRWLTPLGLAYWFMDDGSSNWRESKVLLLNTQGFEKNEIERLSNVLESKFGLEVYLRKQSEGWQIAIAGSARDKFEDLVFPHLWLDMK
jgi:LAGLIDADG DNA endonuclease family